MQNKFPVVVLVLDNNGLQSICLSQKAAFGETIGSDSASGFSLPDLERITLAYKGIEFWEWAPGTDLFTGMQPGHVRVVRAKCPAQNRCPKLVVTYDENKKPSALPLEDMAPLLPWDEFEANMFVTPIKR
jgi:hypothetical protein